MQVNFSAVQMKNKSDNNQQIHSQLNVFFHTGGRSSSFIFLDEPQCVTFVPFISSVDFKMHEKFKDFFFFTWTILDFIRCECTSKRKEKN